MKTNKFLGLAAIGIAALSVNSAQAGGVHVSLGLPLPPIPFVSVCAPRVVCAPAPVIYAPAPVVFAPSPVVYAPAPVVYAPPVYYAAPWGSRGYGYSHYTYGRQGWNGHAASGGGGTTGKLGGWSSACRFMPTQPVSDNYSVPAGGGAVLNRSLQSPTPHFHLPASAYCDPACWLNLSRRDKRNQGHSLTFSLPILTQDLPINASISVFAKLRP